MDREERLTFRGGARMKLEVNLLFLIDTNLISEVLLRQAKTEEVKQFLGSTLPEKLYLTEFSLYSLGIILSRRNMHDVFLQAVNDLLLTGGIRLVRLGLEDMQEIVHAAKRFNLDFDDAYQYAAAEKYDLTIVSFDSDFDRTERGRKTPTELLQEVEDFVQFLLEKRTRKPKGKFKFDWEGALEDLRDQYTSVELQHKALEWWSD